mmetsp:Transcript_27172/g.67387  ORF Transcript_27172/g.67387 Transcript_27172/m.67387 type:complete len:233 (-) Transcript_27172:64-762(-)
MMPSCGWVPCRQSLGPQRARRSCAIPGNESCGQSMLWASVPRCSPNQAPTRGARSGPCKNCATFHHVAEQHRTRRLLPTNGRFLRGDPCLSSSMRTRRSAERAAPLPRRQHVTAAGPSSLSMKPSFLVAANSPTTRAAALHAPAAEARSPARLLGGARASREFRAPSRKRTPQTDARQRHCRLAWSSPLQAFEARAARPLGTPSEVGEGPHRRRYQQRSRWRLSPPGARPQG